MDQTVEVQLRRSVILESDVHKKIVCGMPLRKSTLKERYRQKMSCNMASLQLTAAGCLQLTAAGHIFIY
jgi:hypothetical protein